MADCVSLSSSLHCTGPSLREGAWSLTSWPWQAIQPSWQLLSRPRPLGPTNRRRASPTSTNKAQVGLRPSLTCKPVQPSFKQAQNSGIILTCKHIAKYPVVENPLDSKSPFSKHFFHFYLKSFALMSDLNLSLFLSKGAVGHQCLSETWDKFYQWSHRREPKWTETRAELKLFKTACMRSIHTMESSWRAHFCEQSFSCPGSLISVFTAPKESPATG